ncbi:MAG: 50S ribosomal protein L6 [Bdellovibrionales bacterium]|nr:50S ribosomal protein L6 [Bdellovibrionales bacterium]
MSRIGKLPVEMPNGVKASVSGQIVKVEGPKGKLEYTVHEMLGVSVDGSTVVVTPKDKSKQTRANWGTTRSVIENMVLGVTDKWKKRLELVGVGFTAALAGNKLTLATGYSHKTEVIIPQGIEAKVGKQEIELESCDRQLLGKVAAGIRDVCPPEPYLGKGIRFAGENVRRKAGKAGAK